MKIKVLTFLVIGTLLAGCDKKLNNDQTHLNPIKKIIDYAENRSKIEPTIQDYKDANISGIYKNNIKDLNKIIKILGNNKRLSQLNYDVKKDYIYNFNNSKYIKSTFKIQNNKIRFKNFFIDNNYTSFLKLKVQAKSIGKYFFTHIYLIHNNKRYSYVFEPNAKGVRYLNISNLNIKNREDIKIETKNLEIKSKKVEIISFKNPKLLNKKILILSPHPDDAELAAFGLYSNNYKNTYIVTITAGDAGPTYIYDDLYPNAPYGYKLRLKGKLRVLDSLNVPKFGNIPAENIINLGFFDGTLNKLYDNRSSKIQSLYSEVIDINYFRHLNSSNLSKRLIGDSKWIDLVKNLAIIVNTIKPDIIITPYPLIDRHADHKFTTIALLEALKTLNYKHGKLFLYSNHYVLTGLYPFGGVGDPVNLPPAFNSIYFNSIFSYNLNQETIREKAIALNLMSDLRFPSKGDFFKSANICTDNNIFICSSVLRNFDRNNELFFIIDIKNIYNKNIENRLW